MAKFIFRMQSILNIKESLERQQRNTFAQTKKRLDEEEERLKELYDRKAFYEEEGRRMRDKALKIRDIVDNEAAIERITEYIEEQIANVRLWEQRLEDERLKLVEMMKERKTYEKLKEKAFEEFLESEKHDEGIANDEHNSFVYQNR